MSSEIQSAIVGALIGSVITFGLSWLQKWLGSSKRKKKAMILLKNELKMVSGHLRAYANSVIKFGNPILLGQKWNNFDLVLHPENFKELDDNVSQKVYSLHKSIQYANELQIKAVQSEASASKSMEFAISTQLYAHEMREAIKIARDLMSELKMEDRPEEVPQFGVFGKMK